MTVQWNRRGNSYLLSHTVSDTVNAMYNNMLEIDSQSLEDYVGTFNCTASNKREAVSQIIMLPNGKLKKMTSKCFMYVSYYFTLKLLNYRITIRSTNLVQKLTLHVSAFFLLHYYDGNITMVQK